MIRVSGLGLRRPRTSKAFIGFYEAFNKLSQHQQALLLGAGLSGFRFETRNQCRLSSCADIAEGLGFRVSGFGFRV